jgi:FkbM family methyltransferase
VPAAIVETRPLTMSGLRVLRVRIDPGHVSIAAAALLRMAAERCAECSMMFRHGRPIFAATPYEPDIVLAEFAAGNGYLSGMPRLPREPVVLDIGAHIGMFSVDVLRHRPDARIIAVEPCAASHASLRRNLSLYGGSGTQAVRAAIGARNGVAEIVGFRGASTLTSLATVSSARADHRVVLGTREALGRSLPRLLAKGPWPSSLAREVAAVSLDRLFSPATETVSRRTVSELLTSARIGRVALLKIDVEGSENLVLSGIRADHWPLIDAVAAEANRANVPFLSATLRSHGLVPQVTQAGVVAGGFGHDSVLVRAWRGPDGAGAGQPRSCPPEPLPASPARAAGEVSALLAEAASVARRNWPTGHVLVDCHAEGAPIVLPWHEHGVGLALRHGAAWAQYLMKSYVDADNGAGGLRERLSRTFGQDWTAMMPLLRRYPASLVVAASMAAGQLIDRAVRASGVTKLPGREADNDRIRKQSNRGAPHDG